MSEYKIGVNQGWQCPICGRVYSPYTIMCYYCGGEQKIETTTGTKTTTNQPIHPQQQIDMMMK